jgi:hypothetical protein
MRVPTVTITRCVSTRRTPPPWPIPPPPHTPFSQALNRTLQAYKISPLIQIQFWSGLAQGEKEGVGVRHIYDQHENESNWLLHYLKIYCEGTCEWPNHQNSSMYSFGKGEGVVIDQFISCIWEWRQQADWEGLGWDCPQGDGSMSAIPIRSRVHLKHGLNLSSFAWMKLVSSKY